MSRLLTIGAAQQGPVAGDMPRSAVIERLIDLMRRGAEAGCDLIVAASAIFGSDDHQGTIAGLRGP